MDVKVDKNTLLEKGQHPVKIDMFLCNDRIHKKKKEAF